MKKLAMRTLMNSEMLSPGFPIKIWHQLKDVRIRESVSDHVYGGGSDKHHKVTQLGRICDFVHAPGEGCLTLKSHRKP